MDPQEQARIDEIDRANRAIREEQERIRQQEEARRNQQQPPAHP